MDFDDDNAASGKVRRREYRARSERLLQRLCTALDIEADASSLSVQTARQYAELFPGVDILVVTGTGLERPALPSGSFMYCAFDRSQPEQPFAELTPRNSSLNNLLAAHWNLLPDTPPERLADFILTMQLVGPTSHEVLADIRDLDNSTRREAGFVLHEQTRLLIAASPCPTTLATTAEGMTIQALTLFGWMHEKQNLGVTNIQLAPGGKLRIGERRTICEPVFQEVPQIWY